MRSGLIVFCFYSLAVFAEHAPVRELAPMPRVKKADEQAVEMLAGLIYKSPTELVYLTSELKKMPNWELLLPIVHRRFKEAEQWEVKDAMLRIMCGLPHASSMPELRDAARSSFYDTYRRGCAIEALAELKDPELTPLLLDLAKNAGAQGYEPQSLVTTAASLLAKSGDPRAKAAIMNLFEKGWPSARTLAAGLLVGMQPDAKFKEALEKLANDDKLGGDTRLGMLSAYAKLEPAKVIPIAEGLAGGAKEGRWYPLSVLSGIGSPAAIDAIWRIYEKTKDDGALGYAIHAKDKRGLAAAKATLADPATSVYRLATLAKAGVPGARDILLQVARRGEGRDRYARAATFDLLAEMKDPEVVPILFENLKSADNYLKSRAVSAFGTLGDAKHLEHLAPLYDSRDEMVRSAVIGARLRLDPMMLAHADAQQVETGAGRAREWRFRRWLTVDGEEFAESVNLETKFAETIPNQKGGSCHVFAGVALFAEACYRKTGKWVDISEGYLFNRHLRAELDKYLTYGQSNDRNREKGLITAHDGGWAKDTLDRLLAGTGCGKECFPFDEKFEAAVRAPLAGVYKKIEEGYAGIEASLPKAKKPAEQKEIDKRRQQRRVAVVDAVEREAKRAICTALDDHAKCTLGDNSARDPRIAECAQKVGAYREEGYELKKVLRLLNRGIPVLCSGKFNFGPGNEGMHVSTLIGYRYDETARKMIWRFRDSNFGSPREFTTEGNGESLCQKVTYFP